jgi:uncharacterized DUF497 family protein
MNLYSIVIKQPHDISTPDFRVDPAKAASNLKKHKVSFAEAITVFEDPLASTLPDDQHSLDEDRFITVGMSAKHRILFVVYTETKPGIRIIGARLAIATEIEQYEES